MAGERKLPTDTEFLSFWIDGQNKSFLSAIRPHAIYIGGLTIYALGVRFLVNHVDTTGKLTLAYVTLALLYIVGMPWLWIVWWHKRYARFIRCPQCGDWMGRDTSGHCFGPNPKWKLVVQTGKCPKCGTQLLAKG
jgi:predicted RNA-binding Zn-ribbon protein involved in translation (DUF1610 family)